MDSQLRLQPNDRLPGGCLGCPYPSQSRYRTELARKPARRAHRARVGHPQWTACSAIPIGGRWFRQDDWSTLLSTCVSDGAVPSFVGPAARRALCPAAALGSPSQSDPAVFQLCIFAHRRCAVGASAAANDGGRGWTPATRTNEQGSRLSPRLDRPRIRGDARIGLRRMGSATAVAPASGRCTPGIRWCG